MAEGGGSAEPEPNNWRTVRRLLGVIYLTLLALLIAVDGVPTGRLLQAAIVIVGLAVHTVGRGWRRLLRIVVDWVPFTALLIVYDQSRRLAVAIGLPVHERDVADVEHAMFGQVPAAWLQHQLYDPLTVHWYDAVSTLVYSSHFIATPALAAVLWLRDRRLWFSYVSRVVALSLAGLVTYVLFPEAPPWMAARDHLIEPVARLSARGWVWLRLGDVDDLLAGAQRDGSNPVAAMPSLHTAFAVLVALFVAGRLRSRWRHLVHLYPISMAVVLVYTGEHYVIDVLVGVAYAVAIHRLFCMAEARRRATAPVPFADLVDTETSVPEGAIAAG